MLASDELAEGAIKKFGASVTAQNDYGLYNAEVTRFGEQTAFRGSLSGGVAMMGTLPHFPRRLTDSFALVNVPEYPPLMCACMAITNWQVLPMTMY